MSMPGMPTILKCIRCGSDVKKKDVVLGNAEEIDDKTCVCPKCLPRWQELQVRRKGQPSVSTNEDFVALIQSAKDDDTIKAKILGIARLDAFNRESLLNTCIQTLSLKGAPEELIRAIAQLKDDDIARRVLEVLGP